MKKKIASALLFFVIKQAKLSNLSVKKYFQKDNVDLLLVGEEGKRYYILIKEFSTFMYDHTLHPGRKHFCRYCLQAFSTKEILKFHINDGFKANRKQMIKMTKKVIC